MAIPVNLLISFSLALPGPTAGADPLGAFESVARLSGWSVIITRLAGRQLTTSSLNRQHWNYTQIFLPMQEVFRLFEKFFSHFFALYVSLDASFYLLSACFSVTRLLACPVFGGNRRFPAFQPFFLPFPGPRSVDFT